MRAAALNADLRPALTFDRAELSTWAIDAATCRAIEAVRRLMGADRADFVRMHQDTGEVAVAGTENGGPVPVCADLCRAIGAQAASMSADQPVRWLGNWSGQDGVILLVRVGYREPHGYFLALGIADEADARERAAAFVPDLMNLIGFFVEVGRRRRGLTEERDAAVQALDHGDCGVIALRSDHSIILANKAALGVLGAEAGLHIRRGTIRPTSYGDAIRFQEALDRVIDPPRSERSLPPRAIVMLLTGGLEGRPPVVVIAPARGRGAGEARRPGDAAAVIYLVQPSEAPPRGLETLCRVHGLSRVESRLAVLLANGMPLAQAAAEMRIKVETARSYLKQIFGKVGVHRQAELTGLFARYQRALHGDFDFQVA